MSQTTTTIKLPNTAATRATEGNSKLMLVGIIIAIVAVILQNLYIEMVRHQARPDEFVVYRIERDADIGERLTERDVTAYRMPVDFRETFRNAVERDQLEAQFNRPLTRPVAQYAILTHDLFTDEREQALDHLVADGRRAVTLPIRDDHIPADLRPGMYVDIEAPFRRSGGGQDIPEVMPVMEHVRLLAVGRRTLLDEQLGVSRGRATGRAGTVTIEVTPDQATQLSEIEMLAVGPFHLHMRNPSDRNQPKITTGGINPRLLEWIGRSN